MRIAFRLLALAALVAAPRPASAADDYETCAAFCVSVYAGCTFIAPFFLGQHQSKCEALLDGCVEGCVSALVSSD